MTIKIEQPKHSPDHLSALERTLASHDLRLRPDQDLSTVADCFSANQVVLEENRGYLNASMHGSPVHLNTVVEALAAKEPARFFPRDVAGVKSKDQLDSRGKVEYIRQHGLAAYECLPLRAPVEQTVVLDPARMKRGQYLSLDRKTRAELAGRWGADAIARIMVRK
jgi:hypothetical protein